MQEGFRNSRRAAEQKFACRGVSCRGARLRGSTMKVCPLFFLLSCSHHGCRGETSSQALALPTSGTFIAASPTVRRGLNRRGLVRQRSGISLNRRASLYRRRSKHSTGSVLSRVLDLRGGGWLWFWKEPPRSSMSASIFNLVNNVAGAGLLCLPGGMAAGTGAGAGVVILAMLGMASAYTFALVGYSCNYSSQKTFKALWSRTLGKKTAWTLDFGIAILCFLSAVIYSGIIGDVFTPLLRVAQVPDELNYRSINIVVITALVLLPLSLLKDLSLLSYTSMLGFASVVYTACFISYRSLDGSYKPGGCFHDLAPPSFRAVPGEPRGLWHLDSKALVLVSSLGLAFIAHYNAPKYYNELKNKSPKRFNVVVAVSFLTLSVLYGIVMVTGYTTFGKHSKSNILLNYYSYDPLAVLGRVATGLSIVFGFPLTFIGLRDAFLGTCQSLYEMREKKGEGEATVRGKTGRMVSKSLKAMGSSDNGSKVTMGLLAAVTVLAVAVEDIGFVVGITGSLLGAAICYIVPSIIYVKIVKRYNRRNMSWSTRLNYLYALFGVFVAVLGVGMTCLQHFG